VARRRIKNSLLPGYSQKCCGLPFVPCSSQPDENWWNKISRNSEKTETRRFSISKHAGDLYKCYAAILIELKLYLFYFIFLFWESLYLADAPDPDLPNSPGQDITR
jgi:hypothetical protein